MVLMGVRSSRHDDIKSCETTEELHGTYLLAKASASPLAHPQLKTFQLTKTLRLGTLVSPVSCFALPGTQMLKGSYAEMRALVALVCFVVQSHRNFAPTKSIASCDGVLHETSAVLSIGSLCPLTRAYATQGHREWPRCRARTCTGVRDSH